VPSIQFPGALGKIARPGPWLAIVLVRFVWNFFGQRLSQRLFRRTFVKKNPAPWQHSALICRIGREGLIRLTARWPFHCYAQWQPFPGRDLILLLTSASFRTLFTRTSLSPLVQWLEWAMIDVSAKNPRGTERAAPSQRSPALARLEEMRAPRAKSGRNGRTSPKLIRGRIRQLRQEPSQEASGTRLFSARFEELGPRSYDRRSARETLSKCTNEEHLDNRFQANPAGHRFSPKPGYNDRVKTCLRP